IEGPALERLLVRAHRDELHVVRPVVAEVVHVLAPLHDPAAGEVGAELDGLRVRRRTFVLPRHQAAPRWGGPDGWAGGTPRGGSPASRSSAESPGGAARRSRWCGARSAARSAAGSPARRLRIRSTSAS